MIHPENIVLTLLLMFALPQSAHGRDTSQETTTPSTPSVAPADDNVTPQSLRDDQLSVSGRYTRFERMLTQMADILGRQDPERADLLRRAIGKGREGRIREEIENVVGLIESGEIGNASEKQADIIKSLQALLNLLQSEDRRSAVERETDRLNGLLKDVRNVLAEQKSARAVTQNAPSPSNAAPGQQKAVAETEKLLEQMRAHDQQDSKEADLKENDGNETNDGNTPSNADEEGKQGAGKSESDAPPNDPTDQQPTPPADQKPEGEGKDKPQGDDKSGGAEQGESKGEGKSEGKGKSDPQKSGNEKSATPKSDPDQQPQTPGREQLEKAREEMKSALEELKQQHREAALEKEDNAIEELQKAAEKLEAMLRQLREEEKEMMLASLEARFQRMLQTQTAIHEGTTGVAATPQKDWLDLNYGRCRELSQQQSELTQECAQTVNLLQEDGTSVAIVIAVEDIEADMRSVSNWMQEYKVGELTQSVQTDILNSLKQLIETTQNEMQQMQDHQQQEQQKKDANQEKPALVELMAEIRVLRSLQLQVNRRTRQVDALVPSAPSDDLPALRKQLHDLAIRQNRLIESVRELAKKQSK
ncbi:MAG: hypothetical protein KDB01_03625 [Planctomycetaceae bacterium]|nr:hypothetical protein [Planctomycetaceae bacterium]